MKAASADHLTLIDLTEETIAEEVSKEKAVSVVLSTATAHAVKMEIEDRLVMTDAKVAKEASAGLLATREEKVANAAALTPTDQEEKTASVARSVTTAQTVMVVSVVTLAVTESHTERAGKTG